MSNVSVPGMDEHYYMNIYNTQHRQVVKMLERTDELEMYMITLYQHDPNNPDILHVTLTNGDDDVRVVKLNVITGTQEVETMFKSELYHEEFKDKFNKKLQFIKKKQRVDVEHYNPNNIYNVKFVPFYQSLEEALEEMNNKNSTGTTSNYISGLIAKELGMKEIGVVEDQSIITLSTLTGEEFTVNYVPFDTKITSKKFVGEEVTHMQLSYPIFMIVKGWNEILTYNIPEDLYYYVKLNTPIITESSTIAENYELLWLKAFVDLGPYITYMKIDYCPGYSADPITCRRHKRYIKKSELPRQKLLWGFENLQVEFKEKKVENAFLLQFSKSLFLYATSTKDRTQRIQGIYKRGELIHVPNDGIYAWRKGRRTVIYKPQPVDFVDR